MDRKEIVKKYREMVNRLESLPNSGLVIKWWKDRGVDILSYLELQYIRNNNVLSDDILDPQPDKELRIRLNGFEYLVPMKDISHMGDGNKEPWLIKELSNLKENDIFFDVGANLGQFTVPFAKHAKVYAFEPAKNTYPYLEKNIHINNVARNVTIIKAIVSDHVGNTEFYQSDESNIFSGILNPEEYNSEWKSVRRDIIPTVTVDSIVDEYGISKIDWMKVDVEGAEALVIKGSAGCLERKLVKNILIEMHPISIKGTRHQDIYDMLEKNYNLTVLWRSDTLTSFHYLKASAK